MTNNRNPRRGGARSFGPKTGGGRSAGGRGRSGGGERRYGSGEGRSWSGDGDGRGRGGDSRGRSGGGERRFGGEGRGWSGGDSRGRSGDGERRYGRGDGDGRGRSGDSRGRSGGGERRYSSSDGERGGRGAGRGGSGERRFGGSSGGGERRGNAPGRKGLPSARSIRKRASSAPRFEKQHRTTRPTYRDSNETFEPHPSHSEDGVRLQKALSSAGIASRRVSEDLINAGRVLVDGVVVREQGLRIDIEKAIVHVDGTRVVLDESKSYLVLNKPVGVVCTMDDPEGRPCLNDIVGQRTERLFHVGRLDVDTEGMLILTNDGDLAHRLQHPKFEVPKTYLAEVVGPVRRGLGQRLKEGVELEDGPAHAVGFSLVDSRPGRALVELVITEGRNHIVRRMLEAAGHPVTKLVRTHVGDVGMGNVKAGRYRALSRGEVGSLMRSAGM